MRSTQPGTNIAQNSTLHSHSIAHSMQLRITMTEKTVHNRRKTTYNNVFNKSQTQYAIKSHSQYNPH